jgi:hypothetical protein
MRVYFFDQESGIYQGECYETAPSVLKEDGVTAIAPPPYEQGSVPIFDVREQCWTLKRNDSGIGPPVRRTPVYRIIKSPE